MFKKILAIGDSFTYGEELDDIYLAWPYQIARSLGAQVVNLGEPGSGNRRMVRKIMDHVTDNPDTDLVLIGWSSPGRTEFADMEGVYSIWPGYSCKLFTRDEQLWRVELLEHLNKHHDPAYMFEQYLVDVILTQSFLKTKKIKYLMCNVSGNEYYHKIMTNKFNNLRSEIDQEYFVGWPNTGMTEWAFKCRKGKYGHFLEEGHFRVADELLNAMGKFGWIKY